MSETRKLAAILVADIVGYSRLAGADEDLILARLRTLRSDLIDPTIAVHKGRVVKRTGDGAIVEFRSVVDAVRCAIEVQSGMAERNSGLSEDRRIVFRIGIHVGEVVEEADGDLMGDGVNIAARLEGVAKPGGICLSEDAYRQVKTRLDLKVSDLGPTPLKNIAEPMRVYSLEVGDSAQRTPAPPSRAAEPASKARRPSRRWPAVAVALVVAALAGGAGTYAWRSGLAPRMLGLSAAEDKLATAPRLSIVVLPFKNLSNDPEQDYFADGVTDDLTTDLSHLSNSFVIARNTAFTYKDKAVDVKEIGRELGVRYALEGSVRRVGETITVNAQLISTETGAHVWADRFDGERARLGELQVEFVGRLANSLGVELVKAENLRALRERPSTPDAEDLVMRARVARLRVGPTAINEAIDCLERALKLDPGYTEAKILLAQALADRVGGSWSPDAQTDVDKAEKLVDEALAAQPDSALAHLAKALTYNAAAIASSKDRTPSEHQFENAIAEADAARELDRNLAGAYAMSGLWKMLVGRAEEGFSGVETAIRLSPRDPNRPWWEWIACHLHSHLGQWDQVFEPCLRAMDGMKGVWFPYIDLIAANAFLGRDAEAKTEAAALLKLNPHFTIKAFASMKWTDNPVFNQQYARLVEGLRKAGLPEQ
jgi:class 3 adenylate cyclase/TolB-like protein/tetratricopeptide (TPR) repeat protein